MIGKCAGRYDSLNFRDITGAESTQYTYLGGIVFMKRKIGMTTVVAILCLLTAYTSFAGTTGIAYNTTIPGFGSQQILHDTKTESASIDYYYISLDAGTASSINGSSNYGGNTKVYKGQGYVKIYYDTVPATGVNDVCLYASLSSPFKQTASGSSYCN